MFRIKSNSESNEVYAIFGFYGTTFEMIEAGIYFGSIDLYINCVDFLENEESETS